MSPIAPLQGMEFVVVLVVLLAIAKAFERAAALIEVNTWRTDWENAPRDQPVDLWHLDGYRVPSCLFSRETTMWFDYRLRFHRQSSFSHWRLPPPGPVMKAMQPPHQPEGGE